MSNHRIILDNVSKSYGNFKAVTDLSLCVREGEIFGFLGVNGAGKTTTLKMLAGVLKPTAGRIIVDGFDIETYALKAKQVTGYIPDRPHLYNKLTAREYLYFIADLYRVPLAEADHEIDHLLSEYSLLDWQDDIVESFSHGMKQRLATCGALVHRPKVLIIDEPMVGLDPHGAKMLKESLKRYARNGISILLSTHSLNVAEEVSDRLAIIHRGQILATGTLDEIRSQSGGFEDGLENMFLRLTAEEAEEVTII